MSLSVESKPQLEAMRDKLITTLGETGHRMAELNRESLHLPQSLRDGQQRDGAARDRTHGDGLHECRPVRARAPGNEDATVRRQRLESYVTFSGPGGLATPDDVEALESCQQGAASTVEWSILSRGYFDDEPRMSGASTRRVRRCWHDQLLAETVAV